ncbi:MAG: tape measure protein, partial [Bradyrhizobium sp.]
QLYKLAATTPFEFQDVSAAAKQLLAFGFSSKEAIADLKNIGDTASGLGTGTDGINRMVIALGQMKTAGVVQGDELRQFQEAGVNVYKYMIKAGLITKADIGQIGDMHIDAGAAIKAIMDGMQRDFGGMSKAQSKTWKGQLSTMRDYARQAFGAITKPLFDLGRNKVFPAINDQLIKISEWAKAGGVEKAIDGMNEKIRPFKDAVLRISDAFKKGFEGPKTSVGPFAGLPADGGRDIVSKLSDSIQSGVGQAIKELDTEMLAHKFADVMLKTLNVLMSPEFFYHHFLEILTLALMATKVGFIAKIPLIGPALKYLGQFILDFGKGFIVRAFELLGIWGRKAFTNAIAKLPAAVGAFLLDTAARIASFAKRFASQGGTLGEKLGRGFLNGVRGLVGPVLREGKILAGKLAEGVASLFGKLFNFGKIAGGKVRDGIAGLWSKFYSLGGFLLGKLKDGLINAPLDGLKALGGRIGRTIGSGIGKIKATIGIGGGLAVGELGSDKGNFGIANRMATGFGNIITSGYRAGDPGWHGKNRARDYAGGNMMGFAKAIAGRFGGRLLELIHSPLGWGIKNGRRVSADAFGAAVKADHYDHVHVAMREGGTRGGRGEGAATPKVIWDEGKKREWWISQEGDKKKNIGWAVEALQNLTGGRLKMFRDGGTVGPRAIKDYWLGGGGSSKFSRRMTAIALAESGGNTKSLNHNSNGTIDEGLWQINSVHGFKGMMNPKKNAIAARKILASQGLGAWVVYNTGKYKEFLKAASVAPSGKGKAGKDKKKKSKGLSIIEARDAVLSHLSAQLAAAEMNDDDEVPSTFADNAKVLGRRIKYVNKIVAKLQKKIARLTKDLAKKGLKPSAKRSLTLQRSKAYDDLANYLGIVSGDNQSIAGFGKSSSPGGTDDGRAALLQTLLDGSRANERLLAAQMPIFNRFASLPYAGKFHDGGVVPGSRFSESLALVQGQERILPADSTIAPNITVVVREGAIKEEYIEVIVDDRIGGMARAARGQGPTVGMKGGSSA